MDVRIFPLLLILLVFHNTISAQEQTGSLEGRIFDNLGDPIIDANIILSSESLQGDRGTVTNTLGYFYLYNIPVGNYNVRISYVGKQTTIIKDVIVQLGKRSTLGEIILTEKSENLSEIIVSSNKPLLDPSSTTIGLNLNEKVFDNLPIERNYKALMGISPLATNSFYGDGINLSGSTGWENSYYIDGTNVTDPMRGITGTNLPYNFVKEIEIKNGGYEAEYGSAMGGIANVITNSGSNNFHGQVFGFFTDQSLAGKYKLGIVRKRIKDFATYDFGLSFGGPILFNKLWYFIAYNPTFSDQDVEVPGVGIFKDKIRSHLFAGKLNWQISVKTSMIMTIIGDPTNRESVENQLSNSIPISRANASAGPYLGDINTGGYSVSLNMQHIINNYLFIDGAVSWLESKFNDKALSEYALTEPFFMDITDTINYATEGGYGRLRENDSRRINAKVNGTYLLGHHTIKFGLEYEDNFVDDRTENKGGIDGTLPNPIMRFSAYYIGWWAEKNVRVHNRIPSVYFQDSWLATNRLRINAGLRWDGQFLVGSDGKVAQKITDQWQPRFGLVYQLGTLGTQKIFASFGRYYQQLPLILTSAYFSNDISKTIIFDHDPRENNEGGIPILYKAGIQSEISDLKGQHFDEIILGYERILGEDYILGIKGIYRNLREVVEDAIIPISDEPGSKTKILGNPGRGALSFLPKFTREYSGLELTFQKTRGIFNFLLSYVLSRNYGNYPGVFDSDVIYPDPNLNNLNEANQLVNATGLLPNDRTHVFKLFANYYFGFGLSLGSSLLINSGTPLNEYGPLPPNDNSNIIFHSRRGSNGRSPTIWDWNLRLSYNLNRLLKTFRDFKLVLDVFHLFSQQEAVILNQRRYLTDDGFGNKFADPEYLSPEIYQDPTTVRLGFEINF